MTAESIFEELKEKGTYDLKVEERTVTLDSEMVTFREEMAENFISGTFSKGRVYVDTTMPKRLLAEGLVRDIVRRMQEMRRQMSLPVDAYVSAYVVPPGKAELESLKKKEDYICEEVRAKNLNFLGKGQKRPKVELSREWLIDGRDYFIGMHRIQKRTIKKKRAQSRIARKRPGQQSVK